MERRPAFRDTLARWYPVLPSGIRAYDGCLVFLRLITSLEIRSERTGQVQKLYIIITPEVIRIVGQDGYQ